MVEAMTGATFAEHKRIGYRKYAERLESEIASMERVGSTSRVNIHRGSQDIGGTCIQPSTNQTTILLDLGQPLKEATPPVGLKDAKIDGLVISHPHQDHYGWMEAVGPEVPFYCSELTRELIDIICLVCRKPLPRNLFVYFKHKVPFQIGDFTVTPFLVDHSAVDAFAFLIEGERKRVFYSGDFRSHGRKGVLFKRMVADPPRDIDALFMEGTMLHRDNEEFPIEVSVEKKIYKTIKDQQNISFLVCSSQNVDRLVSAYRACKRAGKILVIDPTRGGDRSALAFAALRRDPQLTSCAPTPAGMPRWKT